MWWFAWAAKLVSRNDLDRLRAATTGSSAVPVGRREPPRRPIEGDARSWPGPGEPCEASLGRPGLILVAPPNAAAGVPATTARSARVSALTRCFGPVMRRRVDARGAPRTIGRIAPRRPPDPA